MCVCVSAQIRVLLSIVITGILAYVGFAGYLNLGQDLWGRPLNYYLIPVAVSVYSASQYATHH